MPQSVPVSAADFPSPAHRLKQVECFVLDMDGTIYLGDRLFPFTAEFLKTARKLGKRVCFFTNNSSRDAAAYLDKLDRMGIPVEPEAMMLSNDVCIGYLRDRYPGRRIYLAGTPLLEQNFLREGISLAADDRDADVAVFGFDTTLVYEKLRILCDIARAGKPVIGVNPDYNCPVEGGFIPDCGSIGALITRSTGVVPVYMGKPSPHTLAHILEKTGCRPEALCIVGDRLYTDIALAQGTAVTSVLVLSGETQPGDLEGSEVQPTLVCRDLAELTGLLLD